MGNLGMCSYQKNLMFHDLKQLSSYNIQCMTSTICIYKETRFLSQGVLSNMSSHKAQIVVSTICVFIITFWQLLHVSQLTVVVVVQCS